MSNKSSGGLVTLLTVLLIVGALAEAGIAMYVGVNMQIAKRANEEATARWVEYEAYQEQIKENPPVVQFAGPTVRVVDGVVTQGEWEPAPAQQTESTTLATYSRYTAAPVPKAEIPKIEDKVKIEPFKYGTGSTSKSSAGTSTPSSGSNAGPSNSSGGGNANNFNLYNNPDQQNTEAKYVLNTNTKKFHYPTCNDVKKIAEKNYSTSNESRDSIINSGYSPCGHCNP